MGQAERPRGAGANKSIRRGGRFNDSRRAANRQSGSDLVRRHRRPGADTERSQHDFHCQRAKDESHYTDEDGRALPTDHPQNPIRKKQEEIGDEEHHHKDNAGFEPLRHRINIVIGQDDHRHHCARSGDGRHRQREHREVAPLLWRTSRLIHFPEKHLHTEQEQNDAAGHFERVHVNADRVENDLADGPGGHEDDRGVKAQLSAPSDAALTV